MRRDGASIDSVDSVDSAGSVDSAPGVAVLPRPEPGEPPRTRVPVPHRRVLPNGMRLLVARVGPMPQAVVRLVVPAGAAADPEAFPGAAALVGAALTEGTRRRDADALNRRIDGLGAALDVRVGHDVAEAEMTLLPETLEEGLALLAEVAAEPSFPEEETERVRAETLDFLLARDDEPADVADDVAALEVFGAEHPYGRPAAGTREGVAAVPIDALAALHAARWRPGGSILVVAGDVDAARVEEAVLAAFGGWRGDAPPLPLPADPPLPRRAGGLVLVEREDAPQSEIRVAGLGIPRTSPDWVPAAVANHVLGGSTILGRLGANLREEKGWTYGARSGFAAGLALGAWAADTAVDVEVTADAVAEMIAELRRMTEEPVPEEELRRSRDAIILSLPQAFETPGRVAGRMAALELHGLPRDEWETLPARVAAVTADDVRRIARRCFDPDRVVRVVVGGGIEP